MCVFGPSENQIEIELVVLRTRFKSHSVLLVRSLKYNPLSKLIGSVANMIYFKRFTGLLENHSV